MKKKKIILYLTCLLSVVPFILAAIVYYHYYDQASSNLTRWANTIYDSFHIYSASVSTSGDAVDKLVKQVSEKEQQSFEEAADEPAIQGSEKEQQLSGDEADVLTVQNSEKKYRFLIEVARFTGPLFLSAAVFGLLKKSLLDIYTVVAGKFPCNYALHGDTAVTQQIKQQLGPRALPLGNPELFRAENHIIAFRNHSRMMAFLSENLPEIMRKKPHKVYIYSDGDIRTEHLDPHLIINNTAKNCARLYWNQHYLKKDERTILFLGFGRYGEELLTYALQNHVFPENRSIQYHVFGNGERYLALHPQLSQFLALNETGQDKDSLFFHSEAWFAQKELIEKADRVILCADTDEENLLLMNELYSSNVRSGMKNYIRLSSPILLKSLWQYKDDRFCIFGTDEELYTLTQATNSELYAKGRLIHAHYYITDKGITDKTPLDCLSDPAFQHEWETTSNYNRRSSIAQDDHSDIKVRALLKNDDIRLTKESAQQAAEQYWKLSEEEQKPYLELEHRRWCRFLWMDGWCYAPARNNIKKHHNLLVPFNELSQDNVRKDENAYKVLRYTGEKLI